MSRKFILSILTLLLASLLLYLGSLTPDAYAALVGTTIAAYTAGNVTQNVMTQTKEN